MRFKRVGLTGVAFPSGRTRCQACPPRGLPALLARSGWLSACWGPIFFVVEWRVRLGAAWARLLTRRPKGQLSHCQVLRVVVAVVSMSQPGCPQKLEVCCLQPCLCDQETAQHSAEAATKTVRKQTRKHSKEAFWTS